MKGWPVNKHLVYVLGKAESDLWHGGHKGAMGWILRNATAKVQARGAARFSLFDADENLLMRIPVDLSTSVDVPRP
jgi:hypothetical protein